MKKILIIEDDPSVRLLIKELLSANNYKVFSASDGAEGIQLVEEVKPDLIICDIMMPDISGYDVIAKVKENKDSKPVPFIFLTALAETADVRKGMEQGADDYITKPFKATNLLKAVEARLERFELIQQKSEENTPEEKKTILTEDDRIFITVNNNPRFIKIGEILCIKANGEYSNLFLLSGTKMLVRKLMKQWEDILPGNIFLRIHRSSIININHIDKIEKWYDRSYRVTLKNFEEHFIISQRYSSKIKANFSG